MLVVVKPQINLSPRPLQPYLKNWNKIWNDSSSKQINMPIISELPDNNTFLRILRMWKWWVKVATNLMWNMNIEWSELRIGEVISYSWHRVMTRCHFHFRRHYLLIVHCTCFHYLQLYILGFTYVYHVSFSNSHFHFSLHCDQLPVDSTITLATIS